MILTKKQVEKRLAASGNLVNSVNQNRGNNTSEPFSETSSETNEEVREVEAVSLSETLERAGNVIEYKDHIKNHNGRPGATNLTEDERVAIGVLANTVGDKIAADLFGISEGTAHRLRSASVSRNPNSTGMQSTKDMSLQEKINERLNNTKVSIQERAAEKLLKSLGVLTEEKLENCEPKLASQIAKDMSQVMKNMNNAGNAETGPKRNVKVVIHQPRQSNEDTFDVIEVGVE